MKILHLIPRFTAGGAERVVLSYARFSRELGVTITVGSVVGGGEMEEEFRKNGVEIFVGRKRGVINFYRNYTEIIQKFRPDIIHSHVFSADVMGFLLARKLKIKWISTQHNVETNASVWRKLVWKIILRLAYKIIAVSDSVYDFCLREWRLPKEKLVLIKNGIELEPWLAASVDELLAAPQLRLATIGRLEKQKGHEILLRALAQLKIDWRLDVFGGGGLDNLLIDLAVRLGINDRVAWRGVVLGLPRELENIDVVVQPSLWEGMSLVVMEAMASGRVVIASEPAAVGLVENNKTGFIVEVGNSNTLTRAIESVASDRAHASMLAASARHCAKENFDVEKNIASLKKVYESIEN